MFKSKLDLIFNWAAFSKACLTVLAPLSDIAQVIPVACNHLVDEIYESKISDGSIVEAADPFLK